MIASPTNSNLPSTAASPAAAPHESARSGARERRKRLARSIRQALLGLLILGATVASVLALRPQPVPIDVARALRGPLAVVIEEDGMTRVKDRFVISAPVTGSLFRLALEPGDPVREGDALAEIAPALSPLLDERTRAQAEARLGAALSSQALEQADFAARMRSEELASAEFGHKVAAEEARVARVALGTDGSASRANRHVDVLAPISGRVLRVHQKSAGVVQAATPLVEIGDPSVLEVVVDLLTTDAVHVTPGTPVVIRGWGGDTEIAARVRQVEPSAFTRPSALGVDEQRVNVVIALTDPRERWAALGDGYRVEARLVLWQ